MNTLPASPSRAQAIAEIEPILHQFFERSTSRIAPPARDAMHYVLFSVRDRFCVSAFWLIGPRLGLSPRKLAPLACALETMRCALLFKAASQPSASQVRMRFVEPAAIEAATFGLPWIAFEMLLDEHSDEWGAEDKVALARTLARSASPLGSLFAMHSETELARKGAHGLFSGAELQAWQRQKISPVFRAAGELLERACGPKAFDGQIAEWFEKLGLFAHWVAELAEPEERSPFSLFKMMTMAEAMDQVKSLETDLFESAKTLDLRGAAHEIIEPLADILKNQLQ